jgi:lantibiotic modifying enzyme
MSKEIKEKIEKINKSISELQNEFSELVKMVLQEKELKITESDLPEKVRDKVTIVDGYDKIILKPKSFLGKEAFAELSDFVKQKGGNYISDGKNSRFEIKK